MLCGSPGKWWSVPSTSPEAPAHGAPLAGIALVAQPPAAAPDLPRLPQNLALEKPTSMLPVLLRASFSQRGAVICRAATTTRLPALSDPTSSHRCCCLLALADTPAVQGRRQQWQNTSMTELGNPGVQSGGVLGQDHCPKSSPKGGLQNATAPWRRGRGFSKRGFVPASCSNALQCSPMSKHLNFSLSKNINTLNNLFQTSILEGVLTAPSCKPLTKEGPEQSRGMCAFQACRIGLQLSEMLSRFGSHYCLPLA